MKVKITILSLLFVFILTSGFGCSPSLSQPTEANKPITLEYWRVFDDQDAFDPIIKSFTDLHPYIKINYRKFRYDEYENELLNALAEDRGPDIFSIPSTWVRKYQNKITPMPDTTTLATPVVQGTLKKETFMQMQTKKSLTVNDLKNNYVDAIYSDAVINVKDEKTGVTKEKIFGLPLYMDTLVMYYNKDLFNNAGIAQPPQYWNTTFQQYVKKLTKQNTKGQIIQSGVALGGSQNIDRSTDILSLLMMQNGAVMLSDTGQVTFNAIPEAFSNQHYNPGLEALRFYTDFANPAKEVYCWNKDLDNSLKMFIDNRLAIMFGYAYQLPQIKADAPKLNFAIANLPQIENSSQTVNFANYWMETVSKKSTHANEAWDFIQYMTKADQVQNYLDKTKKPTALRSLVAKQTEDPDIGIFASQVLTAKSWYHGKDALAAENIMQQMIDAVVGGATPEDAINMSAIKVQQTIN